MSFRPVRIHGSMFVKYLLQQHEEENGYDSGRCKLVSTCFVSVSKLRA